MTDIVWRPARVAQGWETSLATRRSSAVDLGRETRHFARWFPDFVADVTASGFEWGFRQFDARQGAEVWLRRARRSGAAAAFAALNDAHAQTLELLLHAFATRAVEGSGFRVLSFSPRLIGQGDGRVGAALPHAVQMHHDVKGFDAGTFDEQVRAPYFVGRRPTDTRRFSMIVYCRDPRDAVLAALLDGAR